MVGKSVIGHDARKPCGGKAAEKDIVERGVSVFARRKRPARLGRQRFERIPEAGLLENREELLVGEILAPLVGIHVTGDDDGTARPALSARRLHGLDQLPRGGSPLRTIVRL